MYPALSISLFHRFSWRTQKQLFPILPLMAFMASLFFYTSPAAFAGTWTLTLTSSSHSQTVNGVTTAGTWPPHKGTPGPSISLVAFSAPVPASATPGVTESGKASLSVTVTGTWTPVGSLAADPVPATTIVSVATYAGSGGTGSPLVQTADDGYGDPTGVASSVGTHYIVETTSPFTITVSPTASTSATATANVTAMSAPTVGGITMTTYVPTLNIGGAIGTAPSQSILIGQQMTASVSGFPVTPSSWSWSASPGAPFKNWVASQAAATYTPLGSQTSSQLVCYFAQPTTSASVSCLSHLTFPSGSYPTAGLDVTTSQVLDVDKPSAVLGITIGSVTDLPSSTNPNDVQLQSVYTYPASGNAYGITWTGQITTPSAYVISGNYGQWNWTQLLMAQRQEKNNGVYWQFAVDTTTPATQINGIQVLDGQYPYGPATGGFWYTSDGSKGGSADSPAQPLDSSTAIREYDVSDSFNDYLMYLPPGTYSLPVPLKQTSWYWKFQALKDVSNNWSTSQHDANWGYVGDFPAFPTWSFCAYIGHLVFVAP